MKTSAFPSFSARENLNRELNEELWIDDPDQRLRKSRLGVDHILRVFSAVQTTARSTYILVFRDDVFGFNLSEPSRSPSSGGAN